MRNGSQNSKLTYQLDSSPFPNLTCLKIRPFEVFSWKAVVEAFSGVQHCPLQQAWRAKPEENFRGGNVRVAWTDSKLIVYAELNDDDIYNPITELNVPAFQHGDVFEILLHPLEQKSYFEFQISPQNQKLQLRIPSTEAFRAWKREAGLPPAWLVSDCVIESRVRVRVNQGKWWVLAEIPFDLVAEVKRPQSATQWLFSFSRYDYTRGQPSPVLSSTSLHREPSFHRQHEWGTMVFQ